MYVGDRPISSQPDMTLTLLSPRNVTVSQYATFQIEFIHDDYDTWQYDYIEAGYLVTEERVERSRSSSVSWQVGPTASSGDYLVLDNGSLNSSGQNHYDIEVTPYSTIIDVTRYDTFTLTDTTSEATVRDAAITRTVRVDVKAQ